MNKTLKRLIIIFAVFCVGGMIYTIVFGPIHLGSMIYGTSVVSVIDIIDYYLGLKEK